MTPEQARVGEMIPPADLPPHVVRAGGGWVAVEVPGAWRPLAVYVSDGCHRDGTRGFKVLEVRP